MRKGTNYKFNKKLNKHKLTIYVVKVKNNKLSNSAPCFMCTKILKMSDVIKKIIYSDENGNLVSIRIRDYDNQYLTLGDRCCH
jgi:hypothetical protein